MPPKDATDQLMTTGQCAKLARVAARTMAGWIDAGLVKGFRLPGSQDRRVYRPDLIRFLRESGYPVADDGVVATHPPVVVFGQPDAVAAGLTAAFAAVGVGVVALSDATPCGWLDLGLVAARVKPAAVVLDDSWGAAVVARVVGALAAGDRPTPVVLFRDPSADLVKLPGVAASFHTPVDPAAVVRVVVKGT